MKIRTAWYGWATLVGAMAAAWFGPQAWAAPEARPARAYDVAAYIWPSYSDTPELRWAWPERMGEWERVRQAQPKFPGHKLPGLPLWGYVNEADPGVMEMQINAAADHGVNVFIYDWYWYDGRPFLENCLTNGYLKARNNGRVKFYLMWANLDVTYGWDIRNSWDRDTIMYKGAVDRAGFEKLARYVIQSYFAQPSYYTLDGKPVFAIYDLNRFVQGLGGVEAAAEALAWFRAEAVRAGLKGLHLQCILRSNTYNLSGFDNSQAKVPQAEAVKRLNFDSLTHYQFCHFLNVKNPMEKVVALAEAEWAKLAATYDVPYFPHISVGWDSNARYKELRPAIMTDNDPTQLAAALRKAKAYADGKPHQPPLITINAWNEWTEGSYLEPCTRYGYGYLEAVRSVFKPASP